MVLALGESMMMFYSLIEVISVLLMTSGTYLAWSREERKYRVLGLALALIGAILFFRIELMQWSMLNEASVNAQMTQS